MITDSSIREQGYIYFLEEAPELLQTIEADLFSLAGDFSTAKVHNLMRATHTIKGGAANVGLEVINKIAHSLEDIFKALYNPDVELDGELQTLLFQAFECLQLPVTAEISGTSIDADEILQRAAGVFAQLQEKLGDAFGADTYIPTSEELGFDIVLSIFETGVSQRIDSIAEILENPPGNDELVDFLQTQGEVFLGLAESLNLPGFAAIAKAMVDALSRNSHRAVEVGNAVLADLLAARAAVQGGDRVRGGEVSPRLLELAQGVDSSGSDVDSLPLSATTVINTDYHQNQDNQDINIATGEQELIAPRQNSLRDEIEAFYRFLTQGNHKNYKPIKPTSAKFYLKVIRYILGWFNHELEIPESELKLQLLIPIRGIESTLDYLENWLREFFVFLDEFGEGESLRLYRQGVIYTIILALAQFLDGEPQLIRVLQERIQTLANEYKTYPPITNQEKNWLDSPKLQALLEVKKYPASSHSPFSSSENREEMMEAIWGENLPANSNSFPNNLVEDLVPENQPIESDSASQQENTIIESTSIPPSPAINHPHPADSTSEEKPTTPRHRSFVRVDVEGLHKLNYLAGELLIYQKRRSLLDEQLHQVIEKLFSQLSRHQNTLNELREIPLQGQSFTSHQTRNVASVNFDALEMDEYTEYQLTLHSALEESLQLQETAESLDLILRNSIQVHDKKQILALNIIDNLVEARMSPLGNILNRFPQMIQNLANLYKKQVEMKLVGTQVLVDKAIAEKLYDPLLHIVRNAFDHGIETPEERLSKGKPETGTIEIRAYHQGSQTIIEVRDDGKGLNFEKIRQKGLELGLLTNPQSSEDELVDLLFSPGFSTAGKVTDISGRGIGLDIVKTQLRALNGDITLYSRPHQGTTFILKIPFSMTTEQLMLVQAGGATYALLLDSIEKILLPSVTQIRELEGRRVLYWQNGDDEQIIAIRNLAELMHYNSSFVSGASLTHGTTTLDTQDIDNPILILQNGSELLGLQVDQIIGEQELVIRPLGNAIAPPKYIYGCTSLANGNLILVVDGALILTSHQMYPPFETYHQPVLSPSKPTALPISRNETTTAYLESDNLDSFAGMEDAGIKLPSLPASEIPLTVPRWVLVVDDAISLRQTISLTLQKYGYQVIQAENGIEALEKLQHHPEISLVISDLEMPRMNGFELLSHVRQNPSIKDKPIVILTSRSAEKHRQLASALGATAYLTKPYLEHEFLATVEGIFRENSPSPSQKLLGSAT
ncbi:hybrid sensor histidine kinase/response regulator [Calothrix sp. NIES-3974]|uniref:hybrid sensor histidine kinase/response regulator n=1 Tax=Calothrix sp. NIES-3974 TaxID=2005462 RepID=UPI000B620F7E|nr:hybrid sensor histidine kinase/response regulator [Calothrix sp. NIES-3974]BAZ07352.1 CheA signal transduction histidine kinase [Calothrix sp. NIES-3974]